jgi:hypothetical protein
LRKEYAVGFKKSRKIVFDFDKVLPKTNYYPGKEVPHAAAY